MLHVVARSYRTAYNIRGQLVREMLDACLGPGPYQLSWDATDSSGRRVSSGIYFSVLRTENATDSRKIVYVR